MSACPDDGMSLTMAADATVHPSAGHGGSAAAQALAEAAPDPDVVPDLMAGFIVGEYRIDKKIGEGGMGAVYAAVHPMIGKRAAIKVISAALGNDSSAVGRFVQEAKSVNQIGHPNIVDVFSFGRLPDGRNYFVMEYLHGESLAERLARGPLPLGEAIEILDQICDALEAAHEKQIVHRDLKPDNVYLAAVRGGRTLVKLLDFGIAKLSVADGNDGSVAKTRTGMMMGTPGYISPEQARGRNVDHRTDIYALGAMLFEIVTGRLPFVADSAMDMVIMHMTEAPPRASSVWPEIPPPLDALIDRMLAKDAAKRPTLTEARQVFSELVTTGLVTLSGGRGVAFGSSIGRPATPPPGTMTPVPGAIAAGTQPATQAPTTSPPAAAPVGALSTVAPIEAAPRRSKRGLMIGLAAAAVLGGIAVVALTRGGGGDTPRAPAVAASEPSAAPAVPPKVEPTAPEPPKVEVAKVEPGGATPEPSDKPTDKPTDKTVKPAGTIVLTVDADHAEVKLDGKPVTIEGRSGTLTVEAEGPHTVVVSAPGRNSFTRDVDVRGGAAVSVEAKLERSKSTHASTKPPKPPKPPAGKGSGKPPPGHKDDTINPF